MGSHFFARKEQREIRGREVRRVMWAGLDNRVSPAPPEPEGCRGTVVFLAHRDQKEDQYVPRIALTSLFFIS